MDTLYPATALAVKLSPGAASLLRWLHRWHSQTGDVHPSTGYLARKQRKTERTVYRWLAELREAGAICCDVQPGVQRRVTPLVEPLSVQRSPRRNNVTHRSASAAGYENAPMSPPMSGVVSGVVSGVLSLEVDALTQETTTDTTGVVASLIEQGVTHQVAEDLLRSHSEDEVREQVESLPFRKSRDRAAVLVASIRQRWSPPAALGAFRQAQCRADRQASKARAAAVVSAERANRQQDLLRRLSGLSAGERESLEARALALWQQEQPAAARLMAGRSMAGAIVQGYALRLISEGNSV